MFCGFCDELFEYFNFSRSVKVKKRNRLICRQIEEVSVNFSISSKTIDQLFDQFKKCRSSSRLLPKLSINFSITFEKCRSFSRSVSEKFRSHFDRCRSFDRKLSTPWLKFCYETLKPCGRQRKRRPLPHKLHLLQRCRPHKHMSWEEKFSNPKP